MTDREQQRWQEIIDEFRAQNNNEPWCVVGAMAERIRQQEEEIKMLKGKV